MDFEEILREMEALRRRMTEAMFGDLEDLTKRVERGELEGSWQIEPFEGSGVRGFVARGYFRTPEPLERPRPILLPLRPLQRRPREPLYDVREGEDTVQLYIELPGVEREEIDLKVGKDGLEVNAGDFHAVIMLPKGDLDTENFATEHRNGVLTVTIPKRD